MKRNAAAMIEFSGKHVLITGAAGGMGRLFALVFLGLGARVAAWDIDARGLEGLRDIAPGSRDTLKDRLKTYVCDLSDNRAIQNTCNQTLRDLDHIDILINNAGIVSGSLIQDLSDKQIERTFSINSLAPIRVTRALLPSMIERGRGHIVTMASAGSLIGTPRLADYCASKSAVFAFDEALRFELKQQEYPIRTTIICPFYVDTGMFSGVKTRFRWLLPVLSPETVVKKAVRAIYKGKARLIMPPFVYLIFPLRVLPVSWFDWLASFFGVTGSMDDFEGRLDAHAGTNVQPDELAKQSDAVV